MPRKNDAVLAHLIVVDCDARNGFIGRYDRVKMLDMGGCDVIMEGCRSTQITRQHMWRRDAGEKAVKVGGEKPNSRLSAFS